MMLFCKSIPKRVEDDHHHRYHNLQKLQSSSEDDEMAGACTSLTVWRKSLLFSCQGFTVIDSDGNLAFRVESYTKHPSEVILMDGSGKPILSMCRRKKFGLAENCWLIYEGESKGRMKKPMCCVRKHVNMLLQNNLNNVLAYIYRGGSSSSDKRHAYVIEGSYNHRSCKVLDESRRVVAEIKKKQDLTSGVTYGLEVFVLIVSPGFDSGLAMAIILLLDQMFS